MVFDTFCLKLCIIRYGSRVKMSNPGNGVAVSPTPRCISYWKIFRCGPRLRFRWAKDEFVTMRVSRENKSMEWMHIDSPVKKKKLQTVMVGENYVTSIDLLVWRHAISCVTQSGVAEEYPNECPGYNTKQPNGAVSVTLELWGMQSAPSLLSLLGSLWHWMVAPYRALSMDQIELNCVLMINWIA